MEETHWIGPSSVSTSLLIRLKAHDQEAWRRFAELYGPEVYRWCRQAGLQPQDAADVSQEVFQAVAVSLGDFRRERPGDSFRGWIWTITRNKLRDAWRHAERQPHEGIGGSDFQRQLAECLAESEDTDGTDGLTPTDAVVRRALNMIRPDFEDRSWQAFWRVAVEGHPASEVARDLGTNLNAVYIAKSRVLSRLRAELGDLLS
jgi:RNA polymerase sigma-70 factor (ECF subfamily)